MLWRRGLLVQSLALCAAAFQEAAKTSEAAGRLRAFNEALQQQRGQLKAEAGRLQALEADEAKRSQQLDQREAALDRSEREVAALQAELLKEQNKVWSQLQSAKKTKKEGGGDASNLRRPKAALLQREATSATRTSVATTAATGSTERSGVAVQKPRGVFGSDVALVMGAGMVPKELTAATPKSGNGWASSLASLSGEQEDTAAAGENSKLGEFADNDDLLPEITGPDQAAAAAAA
eukprot:TRINITY_DN3550_c0_g1_i1.p1 TRINITY_DN3550_c0_g1~~TRINITY_DN3550_c0_g1_i1.p1  ORF type:complete len:236 (+),score=97.30 TRINITY_DN3550_c0_g1_i1:148-855(+)